MEAGISPAHAVVETANGRTAITFPVAAVTDCIFYDGGHHRI